MGSRGDSWESYGWDEASTQPGEDPDRAEVLRLARHLAEAHQRQSAEALAQVEDLKRALRERAADVARRELEVERRTKELDQLGARGQESRRLRLRRTDPQRDADQAYAEELLTRRETELQERLVALVPRERDVTERESALRARELEIEEADGALARREAELEGSTTERAAALEAAERELAAERERFAQERRRSAGEQELVVEAEALELEQRVRALEERESALALREQQVAVEHERESDETTEKVAELEARLAARESALVAREAELLRVQAGLATQQENIRRRERELDDAELLQERERALPSVPYVSFSEGLDALTGARRRSG
jgi:chromosome segregation ATPase